MSVISVQCTVQLYFYNRKFDTIVDDNLYVVGAAVQVEHGIFYTKFGHAINEVVCYE